MADLGTVIADLTAEGDDLDAIVAALPASSWSAPTPAAGWDIARQIAHLAWTDEVTTVAITDADAFAGYVEAAMADIDGYVDACAAEVADTEPAELLGRWRAGRKALTHALAAVPDGQKLPWFGPPMSATSMATARLMETWAHGQDVADALGRRAGADRAAAATSPTSACAPATSPTGPACARRHPSRSASS